MSCEEKRNMPHTLVEFYVDGKIACKRPISIIGSNIKPVVYIDTERNGAKFAINTEEGKSAKLIRLILNFVSVIVLRMYNKIVFSESNRN